MFTSKSIYTLCNNLGINLPHFSSIWKIQASPKVKSFLWLLLHNSLNTADNLLWKGWSASPACTLCTSNEPESVIHLFHSCTFTSQLSGRMRLTTQQPPVMMTETWITALATNTQLLWLAMSWEVWKERNTRIFQNQQRQPRMIQDRIHMELKQWALAYSH
jgi:zinc-binding in reverse transcriptase